MPVKFRRRTAATDKRFKKKNNCGDYGPPERWQHSGRLLERTESPGILAARATEEHVLDVLALRGLIDVSQSDAALRLKQDFQRAGLAVNTISRYNPESGGGDIYRGKRDRTDAEEAAYQRWRNAVRDMGLAFSEAVVATVCHDEMPAPANVPLLQKGLEHLVDWYGMVRNGKEGKN